jgi:hypothetical protein
LAGRDLLTVFDDVAADDPDGERDWDLLKTLAALYEGTFTVSDIVSAINGNSGAGPVAVSEGDWDGVSDSDSESIDVVRASRRDLLEQLERLLEFPSWHVDRADHIGRRFRGLRNRVVQGFKLDRTPEGKPTKWFVERLNQ